MTIHTPLKEETEHNQKRPLKEDIFDALLEKIISGGYKPGDWLRQEDIASQLGVSMTPVREALDLLDAAGLAERVPYRGVRVPEPTHEEIAESYVTRLLLEKAVSRAAALNREQAHIDALKRIVSQAKKLIRLDDMSASRKLSGDFHFTVVLAAKNTTLARVYKVAVNSFPDWMLYQAMFEHPEALEESVKEEYKEHLAIAEAIQVQDADLAERCAEEHIRDIGSQLVSYLGVPQELLDRKMNQMGF
ncbi:MAG TPA: GntR family transcriptional regulator [Anaerolineales bacterium]|nr:GntR family transcriptional regulator [Anaerolineales bacterium]